MSNESIRVEGSRVVINYDLKGQKSTPVNLSVTIDGKSYSGKDLHLEGDVGNVPPGTGKRIFWNVLMDFPSGLHKEIVAELTTGGDFIEMGFVQGGCFEMGCGRWNDSCEPDEKPPHRVCLDDFNISLYEVTQKQWLDIMGYNPSMNSGCDNCPVEQVSWLDVQKFIRKLNHKTGLKYRLPTEAEWEYAARSLGMKHSWSGTGDDLDVDKYAWVSSNADGQTHPVGSKSPNAIGLYDMTGNVWEMCADWYHKQFYSRSPKDRPRGPRTGVKRVARGGSFFVGPAGSRSTFRSSVQVEYLSSDLGFRLARTR